MMVAKNIFRSLILSMLPALCALSAHGQSRLPEYESSWQIKASVGGSFSLTSPLMPGTHFAESLVAYDDDNFEWGITASYFFHKRWGIEMGYQSFTPKEALNRLPERVNPAIVSEYSRDYYISDLSTLHNRTSGRGYFGVVFRFEKGRFLVYPKLRLGWQEIGINSSRALLKEKGSNSMFRLNYAEEGRHLSCLSFSPAVTFGVKLIGRLYFTVDVELDYFKPDLRLERVVTDLAWGDAQRDEFLRIRKDVVRLSVNAGLTVVVGKRKEFRKAKSQTASPSTYDLLD